jgi:hypothetical protein
LKIASGRDDLSDRARKSRFQYAFMDRLAALPGVESVGCVPTLPLNLGADDWFAATRGIEASGAEAPVRIEGAGGAYFEGCVSSS